MTEDSRISEIRAVLAQEWGDEAYEDFMGDQLTRIRAIVAREPAAPRVFFPGDTVPADTEVQTELGNVYRWSEDRELASYFGPVMEVPPTTHQAWKAAVDRARSERAVQS